MTQASRPVTLVSCGILFNEQGQCLISSRPEGKVYSGWWEFPGGKMEFGETPHATLVREMTEELGMKVHTSSPWVTVTHDYPHAYVKLHFLRCWDWSLEPKSLENQSFGFFNLDEWPEPMLPATKPIARWLSLPKHWLRLESDKESVLKGLEAHEGRCFDAAMLGVKNASEIEFWRSELKRFGVKSIWVSAKCDEVIQQSADGVYLETPEDLALAKHENIAGPAYPEDWSLYEKAGVLFAWAPEFVRVGSSAWERLLMDNPMPIYLSNVRIDNEKYLRPHGAHGWIEKI